MSILNKISIDGFKSIRTLKDFELGRLNVLIGANGAGKSNFIEVFRMLRAMMGLPLPGMQEGGLASYVLDSGGASNLLHNGPQATKEIVFQFLFGVNAYRISLSPTQADALRISSEATQYNPDKSVDAWRSLVSNGIKPKLLSLRNESSAVYPGSHGIGYPVFSSIESWQMYHFHDTGHLAPMKLPSSVLDTDYLRFDGSNIAAYLMNLKNSSSERENRSYQDIVETIQAVAPFFDDFDLRSVQDKVLLVWRQKGSDYRFPPYALSDGTLRFICLTTALLQPYAPSTLILDEPELGLHPYAISLLVEMMQSFTAQGNQLIVSTQSPLVLDHVDPEDVIVVNREDGQSSFNRLDRRDLERWLREFSLGKLWEQGVVQNGGPSHE